MTTPLHLLYKLSTLLLLVVLRRATLASEDSTPQEECGVYFAPSSISYGGYGMFSGIDREAGSNIHELFCPIFPLDNMMETHNMLHGNDHVSTMPIIRSYVWMDPKSHFAKNEFLKQISFLGGGFYSFANSHPYLQNVEKHAYKGQYYDGVFNRHQSPAAGSINFQWDNYDTTKEIKAGEEMFVNYGDDYFIGGREVQYNTTHITQEAYLRAEVIINDMVEFQKNNALCEFGDPLVKLIKTRLIQHHTQAENITSAFPEDSLSWPLDYSIKRLNVGIDLSKTVTGVLDRVYEFRTENTKAKSTLFDRCIVLVKDIMETLDHRVAAALPDNEADMRFLSENGITSLQIKEEDRTRDLAWLKENGICMDHIDLKPSQTPMAGFGAVARRSLKKGTVVDATPLIPIDDISYMNMYKFDLVKHEINFENLKGHQLYMNYCFAHSRSSLLLCMLTSSVWINHKAEGEGANVEYRWASWANDPTQEALKMPLEELKRAPYRKLALEIVAMRDIAQGEELYMDYGVEWQAAWDKHVNEWNPPTGIFADHIPVKHVMQMNYGKPLKTLAEQKIYPYPRSTGMECYMNLKYLIKEELYPPKDVEKPTTEEYDDLSKGILSSSIVERYAIDFIPHMGNGESSDDFVTLQFYYDIFHWQPCDILDSELSGENSTYTVRYYNHNFFLSHAEELDRVDQIPLIMKNVPHMSIRFTTKPFTADTYLPGAFRHPIMMKDELFPSHWKDLEL